MAKFSPEEVSALQAGGNEVCMHNTMHFSSQISSHSQTHNIIFHSQRANQIFLKEWDPLRNSKPDSSNIQKLREFIKFVYVERKYTGESSTSTLSRIRLVTFVYSST